MSTRTLFSLRQNYFVQTTKVGRLANERANLVRLTKHEGSLVALKPNRTLNVSARTTAPR